ncbi:hypothetical protein llap_12320 [Limosa lapponica baueri]|uniref:Uncharacterized protein n=1 Tax=Limosa lapponica baueri TaxID=1758121 RepID=A0A2I0TUC1_LIMLA|nr:hypothetical protein llap_12320 [Limosa lapponica baueri]
MLNKILVPQGPTFRISLLQDLCVNMISETWVFNKEGTLAMKLVNVRAVDALFSDIASAFNKQHEDHAAMTEAAQKLKGVSGCAPTASLTACIGTLQQEHGASKVQVRMEGYSFSLIVKENKVPDKLKQVQQQVGELSRSTKRLLARKTRLQEMICSMLQSQTQLEEKIRTTNPVYLDQVRLEGNLRENLQKIRLAKELSEQYDEAARSVLREMAQLAGLTLEAAPEIGTE